MKTIDIISKKGYRIPCIYEGTGEEQQIVIISHGFGSSKESPTAVTVAEKLNGLGIGAVRYDFPAHGESPVEGEYFLVENCLADLAAVEESISSRYRDRKIGYFSSSFGAFINLLYLSRYPHSGTGSFLRCAAADMAGILRSWMTPEVEADFRERGHTILDQDYARPLKIVSEFYRGVQQIDLFRDYRPGTTRLQMIHGTADETAPYPDAVRFSQTHHIPLISISGADHGFTGPNQMDQVREAAAHFFLSLE